MKIEPEAAVGGDMGVDERGDAAQVVRVQPPGPGRFDEHLLDHEGVDVDQRELKQVEREHSGHEIAKLLRPHRNP